MTSVPPTSSTKAKGAISVTVMMVLVSMFSLLRSIKPSSSYIHPFVHAADVVGKKASTEYREIYQDYVHRALPVAQISQLLFYVVVVFFSSKIGFRNILHADYFCQMCNLVGCALIALPKLRSARTLLIANFMYGISTASSNVFHNYVYSVFEKKHYQKMSSLSRGMAMFGHMIGAFGAFIFLRLYSRAGDFINGFQKMVVEAQGPIDSEEVYSNIIKDIAALNLRRYTILFLVSMGFVMASALIANLFPKVKEIKRSFSLRDISTAAAQLKDRRVAFWAFSWSLNFIVMLYSKTWSSMLWKRHQNRLSVQPDNGLYDMLAYFLCFIGSMLPTYVVKFGFATSIGVQLAVLTLSIVFCLLQSYEHFSSMTAYYILHPLFSLLVYYSLTFQNSELAKSIEHSQIKLLFNLLSFSVFLVQAILNRFIDGNSRMPPVGVSGRYVLLAMLLLISLVVVLVGFVGSSHSESSQAKTEKKQHLEAPIHSQEQQQAVTQNLKSE